MLFQPFKKATKAETPGFADAAYQDSVLNQREEDAARSLFGRNLIGGMTMYNEMTPDSSPIHDALFGVDPVDVSTSAELAGGTEALGLADVGAAGMGVDGLAMAGAAPIAAPTAQAASAGLGMPAVASVAPVAAEGAALTGAGGTGLAAMGPAGWAAMAAMALGLFG